MNPSIYPRMFSWSSFVVATPRKPGPAVLKESVIPLLVAKVVISSIVNMSVVSELAVDMES